MSMYTAAQVREMAATVRALEQREAAGVCRHKDEAFPTPGADMLEVFAQCLDGNWSDEQLARLHAVTTAGEKAIADAKAQMARGDALEAKMHQTIAIAADLQRLFRQTIVEVLDAPASVVRDVATGIAMRPLTSFSEMSADRRQLTREQFEAKWHRRQRPLVDPHE